MTTRPMRAMLPMTSPKPNRADLMPITITGYPLSGEVTISDPRPDTDLHGTGWLLDVEQVTHLLDAWKHAPAGDSDVVREWVYYDHGLFVTVLSLDGEISVSSWEAADGTNGADLYSTVAMPFDFTIRPTPPRKPDERFRLTDTDPTP